MASRKGSPFREQKGRWATARKEATVYTWFAVTCSISILTGLVHGEPEAQRDITMPDLQHEVGKPPMLPLVAALTVSRPDGRGSRGIRHAVGAFLFGSALRDLESSGLAVYLDCRQSPARGAVLWPLLTPPFGVGFEK